MSNSSCGAASDFLGNATPMNLACPVGCSNYPHYYPSLDLCGVCDGNNSCIGCDGKFTNTTYDICGICGGNNTGCPIDCMGVPYGKTKVDICGVYAEVPYLST